MNEQPVAGHARMARLQARLAAQHLLRTLEPVTPETAPFIRIDNQRCINFASNDYLGLARHPKMLAAVKQAVEIYGVGATSSPFICGHTPAHAALAAAIAAFTKRDSVLLLSSGYLANLSLIDSLADKNTLIITDRLAHASILDAARLSAGKLRRYRHLDLTHAKALLSTNTYTTRLLITEGIFSMDGDSSPLPEISRLCQTHQAICIVDDAHGFGIYGTDHQGSLSAAQLGQAEVPVLMATFGKAVGASGAFIAGSADYIEFIKQQARSYRYTTALPAAMAAAAAQGIALLQQESWRQTQLSKLIQYFRSGALALDLPITASTSAIQPIHIGSATRAMQISQKLRAAGFWVPAIRPPTVPNGTARLRITLCSQHDMQQLDDLLTMLVKLL